MSTQTSRSSRSSQPPRRVLIAGAGVAALEALLALRNLAGKRVEADVMAATHDFVYHPLGVVEPFGHEAGEHRLPLGPLARDNGAGHVFDNLAAVDVGARRARGTSGAEYGYDALLVATGARREEALPGAIAFPGPSGASAYRRVLERLATGSVRDVAFVVPAGAVWPLPAYELALLTAAWAWERRLPSPQLTIVTPERRPLAVFGDSASDTVAELLVRHGIDFRRATRATAYGDGQVQLEGGGTLAADAAVALPRLAGPAIAGLATDADGFIRVDDHGRVDGCPGVFAAGDGADWPVKFGGLAAEQADAAAGSIASWAGAPVRPEPFRPVLRAMLLAGNDRLFLRADSRAGRTRSATRAKPLWWPTAKIAGKYLAPYLAAHGVRVPADPAMSPVAVR